MYSAEFVTHDLISQIRQLNGAKENKVVARNAYYPLIDKKRLIKIRKHVNY